MRISTTLTDDAILADLGERLSRRRIDRGLTQARLATEAGVSKRTVERIEAGASAQLSSFIRLLRALDLVHRIDALVPEAAPSPMELMKLRGKQRERAASEKGIDLLGEEWRWGDDT
jgi:transcriptional regulator with XRE-family HTH domain